MHHHHESSVCATAPITMRAAFVPQRQRALVRSEVLQYRARVRGRRFNKLWLSS